MLSNKCTNMAGGREEGGEGDLWLVCKVNRKFLNNKDKKINTQTDLCTDFYTGQSIEML